ncbi:helix-turn-helix transcriptional regulator [Janibacter cremeus]|uniref:DNA-binding NarL/FixJ family response regulator n=1 Tax=Janibacter cremeus TaxID=1285192 RepID=A0A852VMV2_9MICO|nr:LuxR family transcriptional regulator [Janibacter cremeus]NYF96978.1 DNA-binding NarL/FixJ family response regulator [Janibacter cremeus]
MTQHEAGSQLARALRGEWPFTSRDAELDLITALLEETPHEPAGPRGAVVVAPAGVGKTRLLREVRWWAQAQGLPTSSVIATRAASRTPYGAVLHLLPEGVADQPDTNGWHSSFSAQMRAAGRKTVVLVDDAHHLDQATAALLLQLSLDGVATPVVTVRRGESVPDPVTALWKEDLALRVDLQPLSTTEMGDLIRRSLGAPVSARTVARLTKVSGGNVLYARELVMAAAERGSLQTRDGAWMWDEEVVLAPRLVDAVWARLETLDPVQRHALAAVAVGEPLPLTVAEVIAATEVLSSLEEIGLVSVDDSDGRGVLRLGHPLYGEVLVARIGTIGRRRLVGDLAEAFDAADSRDAEASLVRVVTWRLEAGREQSRETLLDAASRANQVFAHPLAARLARAALEAGDADPAGRAPAVIELGRALVGRNRAEEALPLLTQVEDAVLASRDPQLVDDYIEVRFRAKYFGLGHVEDVEALLDRIGATVGPTMGGDRTTSRAERLAPYRASVAIGRGRPREALAIVEPLLERSDLPALHRLMVLEIAGQALGQLGLHQRGAQVWDRLRQFPVGATARASGAGAEADLQAAFSGMLDGRMTDVLPGVTAVHAAMSDSPDVVNRGLACLALGRCLLHVGRLAQARAVLLDAVEDFRTVDLGESLSWALTLLSQTAALSHQPERARRRRDEARVARRGSGPAGQAGDAVMADVWLKVAEGDRTAAAAIALAGAQQYPQLELSRAGLLHLACRLGERGGEVTTSLRRIADRAECEYPSLLADHADAMRTGDRQGLEQVAERFAERGLVPLAVEAATQAARAHRAVGSGDGARRMAGRAQVLARQIDGGVGQTLAPQEPIIELSRREQEVARLAATGLSNAAIAQQLVVSVRTVESHLYQVFAKLGIASRSDLVRYLPPS